MQKKDEGENSLLILFSISAEWLLRVEGWERERHTHTQVFTKKKIRSSSFVEKEGLKILRCIHSFICSVPTKTGYITDRECIVLYSLFVYPSTNNNQLKREKVSISSYNFHYPFTPSLPTPASLKTCTFSLVNPKPKIA